MLTSMDLAPYKKWSLKQLPAYWSISKGDRLPIEGLISFEIAPIIFACLNITQAAFIALADDEAKLTELRRVYNPHTDPASVLGDLRKIKMSPHGHVIVAWSNYTMEFVWEVQLGTAAPIGGRDASTPSMKDIIGIFIDGMRSNLSVKVRAHVVPAMTFTECVDKGFHYVLKIQDAEKFLGIAPTAPSGSTSGSGKMTPEEKAADDKACNRCGKTYETRDCNWPADVVCNLCNKSGHIATICRRKSIPGRGGGGRSGGRDTDGYR